MKEYSKGIFEMLNYEWYYWILYFLKKYTYILSQLRILPLSFYKHFKNYPWSIKLIRMLSEYWDLRQCDSGSQTKIEIFKYQLCTIPSHTDNHICFRFRFRTKILIVFNLHIVFETLMNLFFHRKKKKDNSEEKKWLNIIETIY